MTTISIMFYSLEPLGKTPYICGQEPLSYKCDGKEGEIYFNGYYYVENHAPPYPEDEQLESWRRPRRYDQYLPKTLIMHMTETENEPSIVKVIDGKETRCHKNIQNHMYEIEIYKRVIHECTNQISQIEDGGDIIDVCFFPTNTQTIYFRVLKDEVL
jgi:hypothetical protein